jgi:hypothetical protein
MKKAIILGSIFMLLSVTAAVLITIGGDGEADDRPEREV